MPTVAILLRTKCASFGHQAQICMSKDSCRLVFTRKFVMDVKDTKEPGMVPCMLLIPKLNVVSPVQALSSGGTVPLILLICAKSVSSFVILAHDAGMDPLSFCSYRYISSMLVKLCQGGRVPEIFVV